MYEALFRQFGRHVQLTEEERLHCSTFFTYRRYRKRQYILQEGQINPHTSFIVKGLVRMYEVDEKGQEHIIKFALEDWWTGDGYSFYNQVPSQYNIDCLEDTEVLQITMPKLDQLYDEIPKLERYFRILFQNAFFVSVRRTSSSLALNASEQYHDFTQKYPQIEQRIPNHQIASYLGITPQSLSRIRSQAMAKR